MAKKKEEQKEELNEFTIDDTPFVEPVAVPVVNEEPVRSKVHVADRSRDVNGLVNCLSNTTITVKHLPQPGSITDPKHVLYGGMAERSSVVITVPRLRSGTFKNVLTDEEKNFLEAKMGLEVGAMSVYNKKDNFWDNTTEGGISKVRLTKFDTQLHLNDPIDYIKYKILLANTDLIAPDLQTLRDRPKATYKFVLVSDSDVNDVAKSKMTTKMQCYVEYGKIENNADVLRTVIEIITSKPLDKNTKLDFLQTKAGDLIEADAKLFLSVVKDPLLKTKVLIQKCIEQGFISKRGDYLYLRSDNTPLCESGEEPVLSVAARYLSNPKRQEIKFNLEAKLNR